jgi:hypothetical protein
VEQIHNSNLIAAFGMTGRQSSSRKPATCRSENGDARRSEKRGVCVLPPR